MQEIIEILSNNNLTVSTMESCTGGGIVNAITNIPGASDVIKFSAITYSNEFKIRFGINPKTIDTYSVYSEEVAREMCFNIVEFTGSDYGIGITGKINNDDKNNLRGDLNTAFISFYSRYFDKYYNYKLEVLGNNREESKAYIIGFIIEKFKEVLSLELGLENTAPKKYVNKKTSI